MDTSTSNSEARKENPSKYMRQLKISRLTLMEKFFNTDLELLVEIWKGETENEYFSIDFAYNYSSCAAMGSISERESNLGAYKEILWAKDELFDIMGLAKYLKWDTSNTVIEDLSEKV
jgi:hypothetical protein